MIIKLISGPLIGTIIGYFTNWLAVRMLFRPREAKYINGCRVPFTPGVIPRGKERLAGAVSSVINTQLLTEEAVKQHLASGEMQGAVQQTVRRFKEQLRSDERTIHEYLLSLVEESRIESSAEKLQDLLTEKITSRLKDGNIAQIIAKVFESKLNEMMANSFLGKMFGDSVITSIASAIENTIDDYIVQYGEPVIRSMIKEETERLLSKQICDAAASFDDLNLDLEAYILEIYRHFAMEKSYNIICRLNIGSIAEKAIREMNNQQLEQLVLSAMKTELNTVVRLGALIGCILGLINLVIYLI